MLQAEGTQWGLACVRSRDGEFRPAVKRRWAYRGGRRGLLLQEVWDGDRSPLREVAG